MESTPEKPPFSLRKLKGLNSLRDLFHIFSNVNVILFPVNQNFDFCPIHSRIVFRRKMQEKCWKLKSVSTVQKACFQKGEREIAIELSARGSKIGNVREK